MLPDILFEIKLFIQSSSPWNEHASWWTQPIFRLWRLPPPPPQVPPNNNKLKNCTGDDDVELYVLRRQLWDKLWPVPKHSSMLLYVHRNHQAQQDGEPRAATLTFTQLLNSGTGDADDDDHFYTALISAHEQTLSVFVACDSNPVTVAVYNAFWGTIHWSGVYAAGKQKVNPLSDSEAILNSKTDHFHLHPIAKGGADVKHSWFMIGLAYLAA